MNTIKIFHNKTSLPFISATWSGSADQASRSLSFSIPANPHKREEWGTSLELGDIITLYVGKVCYYTGVITGRKRQNAAGGVTYDSKDFMHYLLRSTITHKFTNMKPEDIAAYCIAQVGMKKESIATTGVNIPKLICEDMSLYDIIIKAYNIARTYTKHNYLPVMTNSKFSVILRGNWSGVILLNGENVTAADYSDNTDSMVNAVRIYDDNGNVLGQVNNADYQKKYGVYLSSYKKEDKVNPTSAATALLEGISKEASVSAFGDVRATAGKEIVLQDRGTNLYGHFWILEDTHTFENNTHMMQLKLSWENVMEASK